MARNLIPELPSDTQVWEEIDTNGVSIYYLVYTLPSEARSLATGLDNFTWRYKVSNLEEITQAGQRTVVPDVVVKRDGEVYEMQGSSSIGLDAYKNSFFFGNHTQLSAISGQVEDGATGYEYFIQALDVESQYKPYLFSQDSNGNYDYLSVVIEAALEGRTARPAELANTTWWKTHTAPERQALLSEQQDPSTWARNGVRTREDVVNRMINEGVQTIDPKIVNHIANKVQAGTYTDDDLNNIIAKLSNPRIRFELDPELKALLEGKTLDFIDQTLQLENTINAVLGPGSAENFDMEAIQNEREVNPVWFQEEFLPSLQDQFQSTYSQFKGTNVKQYEFAAPQFRSEWESITGQKADESSSSWKQFMATNDIAERKDIAFSEAARLGTQTYRDTVQADLKSTFGSAGQRSTGRGSFE